MLYAKIKLYKLWLDDERPANKDWVVCRSSQEAIEYVKTHGCPVYMSLDHDLGINDTTMVFLKALMDMWDGLTPPPEYKVHSANPVGKLNIISYMESWKKIVP